MHAAQPDAPTGGTDVSTAPPARPPVAAADGAIHALDPRRVQLDRTLNAITGGVLSAMHLLACPIAWLAGATMAAVALLAAWLPVTALLAWLAIRWPAIVHRHWRYRVAPDLLEIWSGVIWRRAVAVPRTRVQHIDVSQGPLERSYGLATLSVYTAGTEYSRVDLPGLDHAVALAVRDALLPTDAERAV